MLVYWEDVESACGEREKCVGAWEQVRRDVGKGMGCVGR